ncbi:MAG: glycerophosphodiester phosphodiesterase [Candidatus Marinimicrobia bacterium]|nr:glycerophosphodiester phosphodiesterase [Candidatus Neomarinimicrobiota bacterium]MCK9559677.1 glycerophosphodiester phosphodiesterase [Candidatus Neomarinimicrobiota bacterium]
MSAGQVQIIAHQGASGHAPENSLAAFEKAIALGADWIELDVHRVEQELFIIHDYRLERTTEGKGSIYDKTVAEVRKLRLAGQYPIPTLREVLDIVARRVKINIEIKSPDTAALVIQLVDEYVAERGWTYSQFMLTSFNQYEILAAKQIQPRLATGVIIYGLPFGLAEFTRPLGVRALVVCIEFINSELVASAHRHGLEIIVYTVNYPDDIQRMLELGVDGIVTNYPDLARKIIEEGGIK